MSRRKGFSYRAPSYKAPKFKTPKYRAPKIKVPKYRPPKAPRMPRGFRTSSFHSPRRPLNLCGSCGYSWHPRGHNLSSKCPSCSSPNVQVPQASGDDLKVLLVLFAILVVVGGIIFVPLLTVLTLVFGTIVWGVVKSDSSAPPKNIIEEPAETKHDEQSPSEAPPPPPPATASSRSSAWVVLGVEPGASAAELRSAYLARSREYHPDRVDGLGPKLRQVAEEEMKSINAAYEELQRVLGSRIGADGDE